VLTATFGFDQHFFETVAQTASIGKGRQHIVGCEKLQLLLCQITFVNVTHRDDETLYVGIVEQVGQIRVMPSGGCIAVPINAGIRVLVRVGVGVCVRVDTKLDAARL
jgi:hypothetical protein